MTWSVKWALNRCCCFWAFLFFLLVCNHQWRDGTYSNQNQREGCGQSRRLCRRVVNRRSTHSWFAVLSSPRRRDRCLLTHSERGTVIRRSERVTACICTKSFDDAEQRGVQVSQTARHAGQVIQMSLCSCHGREIPLYRDSNKINRTENIGIVYLNVLLSAECLQTQQPSAADGEQETSEPVINM